MKAKTIAYLIGMNAKESKSGKRCYLFVDGERISNGLYLDPTALTYWADKGVEIPTTALGQAFNVVVDIIGEAIIVKEATPIVAAK